MRPLLFFLLSAPLLTLSWSGHAQGKFMTKTGRVSFFSTSIIEDIEAHNTSTGAVIDLSTGQIAFSVPVKEFVFKRSLMQEHFNENYMESGKYPRATFSGQLTGADATMLRSPGSHAVKVEGILTLHGVPHRVEVAGTLELKGPQLLAFAYFSVAPADYNIAIPLLVRENIAKIVSIRVALTCEQVGGNSAPVSRSDSSH